MLQQYQLGSQLGCASAGCQLTGRHTEAGKPSVRQCRLGLGWAGLLTRIRTPQSHGYSCCPPDAIQLPADLAADFIHLHSSCFSCMWGHAGLQACIRHLVHLRCPRSLEAWPASRQVPQWPQFPPRGPCHRDVWSGILHAGVRASRAEAAPYASSENAYALARPASWKPWSWNTASAWFTRLMQLHTCNRGARLGVKLILAHASPSWTAACLLMPCCDTH